MCVIFITETNRPPEDMVEGAFKANSSGAGIAWRENGQVHWRKGLNLEEIQVACAEKPLPYIAHFRIPTCGGDGMGLNHPFEISEVTDLSLTGSTLNHVLFHNGHWGEWKHQMRTAAANFRTKIPNGRWSDSRAMAWCAAIMGHGFLETVDEKVAIIGPGENDLEVYGTWIWAEKEQIWVSNKGYEHRRTPWKATGVDNSPTHPTHQEGRNDYYTRLPASLDRVDTTNGNTKGPGGASAENPFAQVINQWREMDALFKAGNLSKSQWKKARKVYDKAMIQLGKEERNRLAVARNEEFNRIVDQALAPGLSVH